MSVETSVGISWHRQLLLRDSYRKEKIIKHFKPHKPDCVPYNYCIGYMKVVTGYPDPGR